MQASSLAVSNGLLGFGVVHSLGKDQEFAAYCWGAQSIWT